MFSDKQLKPTMMSRGPNQLLAASCLMFVVASVHLISPATAGERNSDGNLESISLPRGDPDKRFYTTKDLMYSIMNFYSTRKNKSGGRGRGMPAAELKELPREAAAGGDTAGDSQQDLTVNPEKRGLSIMDLKHLDDHFDVPQDEETCRKVCHFCKTKLSMRWAALCHAQCRQGGHEYYACVVIWHAMYSEALQNKENTHNFN